MNTFIEMEYTDNGSPNGKPLDAMIALEHIVSFRRVSSDQFRVTMIGGHILDLPASMAQKFDGALRESGVKIITIKQ